MSISTTTGNRPVPPKRLKAPRQPGWYIPWIFVGVFMVVLAVNGIMVHFAVSSWTGIETENHFIKGLGYNNDLAGGAILDVGGYPVLRVEYSAVPNAIASFLLFLRDRTGKCPHAYFAWSEGSPVANLFRFLFLGEGDTAPVTREILRQAEPDPKRRPAIHVGG